MAASRKRCLHQHQLACASTAIHDWRGQMLQHQHSAGSDAEILHTQARAAVVQDRRRQRHRHQPSIAACPTTKPQRRRSRGHSDPGRSVERPLRPTLRAIRSGSPAASLAGSELLPSFPHRCLIRPVARIIVDDQTRFSGKRIEHHQFMPTVIDRSRALRGHISPIYSLPAPAIRLQILLCNLSLHLQQVLPPSGILHAILIASATAPDRGRTGQQCCSDSECSRPAASRRRSRNWRLARTPR